MTEQASGQALLDAIRRSRGYVVPAHEYLADHDPAFLAAYDDFVGAALFGRHRHPAALPVRYRELIVSAVLAFRGASSTAIAQHLRRARTDGATDTEMLEAFEAAAVPGGVPTLLRGVEALMQLDRPHPSQGDQTTTADDGDTRSPNS